MKKNRLLGRIAAVIILVFPGCSAKKPASDGGTVRLTMSKNVAESVNGELYSDESGRLNFADFETMNTTVLCSKPNCPHTDENDCSAFGMNNFPFIYGDKLYFFNTEVIFEDEEIREDTTIFKADLDGTNRTALNTIEGYTVETSYMQLVGDTVYMAVKKVGWDNETGVRSGAQEIRLASFNLSANKLEMLEEICRGEGGASIIIHGLQNGKIYFYQNSTDDPWNADDPLNEQGSRHYDEDFRAFDISSGKVCDTDLPEPYCIGDGYYVYSENGGTKILGEDGSEKIVKDFQLTDTIISPVNGKIINCFTNTWLNLTNGEYGELKGLDEEMRRYKPVYYLDGTYIFEKWTGEAYEFIKIPEKELF